MHSRSRWLMLGLAAALTLLLAPALAGAQDASYVIGPEDVIEVEVWDNKDLNRTVFVRPDGKTSLPLIGEIQAGGRTVQQLQDDLVKAYSRTVKVPSVTVIIKEIKSRPVYFIGGFTRPGPMQLTRNDMTLLEATAMIGGVAPTGDAEKGFVLRAGTIFALTCSERSAVMRSRSTHTREGRLENDMPAVATRGVGGRSCELAPAAPRRRATSAR